MSEAPVNRSPLDRAAELTTRMPFALACAWWLLGAGAFLGLLQTKASLDSLFTGLMVVCIAMATQLLSPQAARLGWAVLGVALLGLYSAEQHSGVTAQPSDPLLGITAGLTALLLGMLQARHMHRLREDEQRQRQEQEAKARRAEDEASRARSDFFSVMNHEIRTPLNGIVGLVTLIQDERVEAGNRHQYLRMLEQSSQALSNLVNGALGLSTIESDRIDRLQEAFSIPRWAQDLESSFSASAAVKGLFLQVELDASVGNDALGDARRLRQIAAHYVSHAIKFTQAGTIRVRISRPRGDDLLRLEVRDGGLGPTDSAQPGWFKPLQEGGARFQREFGGAGSGLSICERLAQHMGGTVGVHSLPGVGSALWVEVPVRVRDARQGAPLLVPDHHDAQAGHKPKLYSVGESDAPGHRNPLAAFDLDAAHVLVVDDNAVNRTTTSQMLRRMNAIVATANDGQEGLDAVRTAQADGWPFDLVLMDVQMPGMDGLTAVGLLRADPALQQTPVVALTAGVLQEDVTRAIEAGMDGFLAKPVTAERLGRNVAHFADVGRQRRRAAQVLKF